VDVVDEMIVGCRQQEEKQCGNGDDDETGMSERKMNHQVICYMTR
jgi:hypothetical protein